MKLSVLPVSIKAFVLILFIFTLTVTLAKLEDDADATTAIRELVFPAAAAVPCLFDKQTFAKCPFFRHFLQVASLAGHAERRWRALPQK